MKQKEGSKQWIYEEDKKIKEIKFQFKDKERPISYVRDLASILHVIQFYCLTILLLKIFIAQEFYCFTSTLINL